MSCMVAGDARQSGLTELRRGVLEYCVLAVVEQGETYAFEIIRLLAEAGGLVTSEGTVYPLLARLRRNGLVTSSWRESDAGPPRRYYRLTDAGKRALDAFAAEWTDFTTSVDRLLERAHGGSDQK